MQIRVFTKIVLLGLLGLSKASLASGFQLFEANGAGTGDFYAGGAASAEDASTAYFNPAGLVRMTHPQMTLSAVNIFSQDKFTGTDTWSNPTARGAIFIQSGGTLLLPNTYILSGSAEGGNYKVVPAFNYAAPINDEFYMGFSVAVPFGLSTDYDSNSFIKYSATESTLQVIDLSPVIAFKVTDKLSLGAGPDFDYLDATFDSMAGFPTYGNIPAFNNPAAFDTKSENKASGWGYGWHAGALYQFTPCTRVGLAYHSKVSFGVNGDSRFKGPLAGGLATLSHPVYSEFTTDNLSANTTLPASTMLSFYHDIDRMWAVMGSVNYTQWSVFDHLELNNVILADPANYLNPYTANVYIPENFHNTWRVSTGLSYQPDKVWKFRAGVGYDQNPTTAQYRNARLPDGNRTAVAVGAHYQASKAIGLDIGWTHLFFQDSGVNVTQTIGTQTTTTAAKARSSADLVGLQLSWDFI